MDVVDRGVPTKRPEDAFRLVLHNLSNRDTRQIEDPLVHTVLDPTSDSLRSQQGVATFLRVNDDLRKVMFPHLRERNGESVIKIEHTVWLRSQRIGAGWIQDPLYQALESFQSLLVRLRDRLGPEASFMMSCPR